MNGKKGDDPILDITYHKIGRYSPAADALIAEIVALGARRELESAFDLHNPPPLEAFEQELRQMRDRILTDRKKRGWEV